MLSVAKRLVGQSFKIAEILLSGDNYAQINNVLLELIELSCGVPQGYVLGSLQFYIFMSILEASVLSW